MSLTAVAENTATAKNTNARQWLNWIPRLAAAGILGMGAFTEFFAYTPEGSMALAEALGVGRGVITLIGIVELSAVVLLLVPRWRLFGAALATVTMIGALFSHATKIGWSGNAAADMWPLALVALAAAGFVLFDARPRGKTAG